MIDVPSKKVLGFLSTPSARRATPGTTPGLLLCSYFYPRPPRGGRPARKYQNDPKSDFYPRPPRGGRPVSVAMFMVRRIISIHALREEGDLTCQHQSDAAHNFYPRPPRGGRHYDAAVFRQHGEFLSTPSARRATRAAGAGYTGIKISIHALREEGDVRSCTGRAAHTRFLSTPSARRATTNTRTGGQQLWISIHALREEGDLLFAIGHHVYAISIHALREEGDC